MRLLKISFASLIVHPTRGTMRDKIAKKSRAFQSLLIYRSSFAFVSFSPSRSLSLHLSFVCRQRSGSRLLTSRRAFFQRVVKLRRGERINITRANCALSRQAAKEKSKNCTVRRFPRAALYIPRWSHPFRRENGQWHRRMLSGRFRWSPIVGGQSDAIVKTGARLESQYQFSYVL